ncbi:general secretion pathway protein C [Candidatus Magnetomorum sp. HK-1]|nr:general secretion pathway protein C [Candidatus Magnetomorum sp. HK-1]
MSKTKVLIKIVPIIGLIVITATIVFLGISFYWSIALLSEHFSVDKKNNQSEVLQQALLAEFESNNDKPETNLIDILEPDIPDQTASEADNITKSMDGFIDLYDLYNLKVLAILTGDEVESVAVIKDPKVNTTQQYYEGDSIRGAIVKKILARKVIVRWNDRDIELLLIEKQKTKRIESRREKKERHLKELIITPEKKIKKPVVREEVKAFHSDIDFLRNAELKLIINGDKFEGVEVSGVIPGSFLHLFGIQDGDLVIGLNGKKLFSKNAKSFLAYLSHMRDATVEVKRDGIIHQLSYSYHDYPVEDNKEMVEDNLQLQQKKTNQEE